MALIKTVKNKKPTWGKRCYFAVNATIAGDIRMGDDCSVWFGAVLRADVDGITMGSRVNVQDGACVHQTHNYPVTIEDDVSIGHNATVHGCTLRRGSLVGMGAVVLDRADVGAGSIVAAGAVVAQGTHIGPGEIWGGIPAKLIKRVAEGQAETFARHYMDIKKDYEENAR